MNPKAFEPIETLVQKAASLTIAQETWLTFALVQSAYSTDDRNAAENRAA